MSAGRCVPEARIFTLRDGTRALLRPIDPDDKEELQRGFERLSRTSRYRRFFTAMSRLSESQLAYFTEIDYVDHFAWVAQAIDEPGKPGMGVGRYIRLKDEPDTADIALAVADDYQGLGLGGILLELLAETAMQQGITRFVGHVLMDNQPMLALLERAGARVVGEEPGILRTEVRLPPEHRELRGSEVFEVLRGAAGAHAPEDR